MKTIDRYGTSFKIVDRQTGHPFPFPSRPLFASEKNRLNLQDWNRWCANDSLFVERSILIAFLFGQILNIFVRESRRT